MSCDKCGANPATDSTVALKRVNEKGVKGIWRCYPCFGLKKPTLVEVIKGIEHDA